MSSSEQELRQRKPEEGKADVAKKDPPKQKTDAERIDALIQASAAKAPPQIANIVKKLSPVIQLGVVIVNNVGPVVLKITNGLIWLNEVLPMDIIYALLGLGLCFCGGMYPATIAAVEAFRQCGWDTTAHYLKTLKQDLDVAIKANKEDDLRDDDGDGIADVDQISSQELITRKVGLFFRTVRDPNKVSVALSGIYTAWLGVQATLKLQFARTISLGISIGNILRPVALRFGIPILASLLPAEYHHWIETLINYIVKSIAISIAWYIQAVLSAVHSALRGGTMFSRRLLAYANKKKYVDLKDEDTYLDEVVGYTVAALGVYFQLRSGFSVPFPLNILLLPFNTIEWFVKWSISS